MGTTGDFDFNDFESSMNEWAGDATEQHFAQELAERARAKGLSNVDSLDFSTEVEGDPDGKISVDPARVKALANEILANDG